MRRLALLLTLVLTGVGSAEGTVEVLTLQGQPQPVATSGGHVLAGRRITGQLVSLSESGVTLQGPKGPIEIRAADLLDVRFPAAKTPVQNPKTPVVKTRAWVRLVDGGRISCRTLTATPRQVQVQTQHLGDVTLPAGRVATVRLGTLDAAVADAWNELRGREIKRDRLVIRKGNVLDHLDGVVGEIDAKVVKFLLDGDELPVPRERVFGILFFRNVARSKPAACQAVLRGGDTLALSAVSMRAAICQATLEGGQQVKLPFARLERLDFAASRVVYLSALVPRDIEYTPYFDVTWKYRRDTNLDGGPLRVNGKTFARGLALHSKTRLVYSLARRHRRFQAWMGIDALVGRRGNVHVVISADGKKLLEADVKGTEKPRLVDLDITGLRELQILVDYGGDLDIADHLDLADAKLVR
ncbi:MAG: NPCBM/NEW2 domain-containing protein [Planctomycetaceae bacterium]|jgi:hypothetical protein|nr:NPCBM/NEW2 domain-containing protein [Planctomycetaceae bacterium]